jgi:hypothetical protein
MGLLTSCESNAMQLFPSRELSSSETYIRSNEVHAVTAMESSVESSVESNVESNVDNVFVVIRITETNPRHYGK